MCQKFRKFVKWSFLTNFVSSIEYTLSLHSMLSVRSSFGADLTFSANFIGKDAIGQVGSLYYIYRKSKKYDTDTSKIGMTTVGIQEVSVFCESLTPLIGEPYFLPLTSLTGIGKNISMVGIGSINAKILKDISTDNIGELYAKATICNTLSSSLGTAVGLGIIYLIPDDTTRLAVFPPLIAIRMWSFLKLLNLVETSDSF